MSEIDDTFDMEAGLAAALASALAKGRIPMPPRERARKRRNTAAARERLKAKGAPSGEDVAIALGVAAAQALQAAMHSKDLREGPARGVTDRVVRGALEELVDRGFDRSEASRRLYRFVHHGGRLRPKIWTPGVRTKPALPPVTSGNRVSASEEA